MNARPSEWRNKKRLNKIKYVQEKSKIKNYKSEIME